MTGKHVIRTSDRITFKRCRRAWDWGSFQRQQYRAQVAPKPLDFGISMHEAWAVYYDPDTWHIPRHQMLEPMLARFLAVTQEQLESYRDVKGDLFYELEEDFEERRMLGAMMIKHYVEWAPKVDNFEPVRAEYLFEVPVLIPGEKTRMMCRCHSWPVVYQGRIDGVVRDTLGHYWVLEHKTAGQLQNTNHLVLDEQCGSYAWALRELGVNVRGVIYNEALKDWPKPPTQLKNTREGRSFSVNRNQRTTYEVYLSTIQKAGEDPALYEEFLEYLRDMGNPFFRRTQVHRNVHELTDLGERISYEAMDQLDPNLLIYPNPSRINCQGCVFREPCVMKNEGSDYQFYLDEFFTRGDSSYGSEEAESDSEPVG